MAIKNQEIPMETAGFVSDLAGLPSFLIDPESAAKRVHSKWFWVVALLVCGAVAIGVGLYTGPFRIHVMEVAPLPDGMTAEQHDRIVAGTKIGVTYGSYFSPLVIAFFWALDAGILLALTAVTGVNASFRSLFNLVAGCSLIQSLATIAGAAILHFKGEVSTIAELTPAMGPDIFLPEGTSKYLMAAASSFSVFQIWWLVMMALVFAAAFRVSKAKSLFMVLPLWVFGMLLMVGIAAVQK